MPEPELPHQGLAKVSPETARLARALYQDGMPMAEIVRQTGISIRTVYYWIDRHITAEGVVTLSARNGSRHGGGWNGRMGLWRKVFRLKTRKACAVPSLPPHGWMSWPNGSGQMMRSTCCNLVCGWVTNRALWRQSVLPLVKRIAEGLSCWLGPAYGADLRLVPDLDQVEALSGERTELWSRVGAADFLSEEEKRAAVGYGA